MGCKCLYHGADFDGKCSAAIVRIKYNFAELYPVYYCNNLKIKSSGQIQVINNNSNSKQKNYNIIELNKNDMVVMCDFSFSNFDVMKFIQDNSKKFIWLDHHYTAIIDAKRNNFETYGLLNENLSGCSLTWEYFFTDKSLPYSVTLLEKYDIGDFYYNKDVLPFEYGLRTIKNTEPTNIDFWLKIFQDNTFVKKIIKEGHICLDYQRKINESLIKNVFQIRFSGWNCLGINTIKLDSLFFEELEKLDPYDILITFSKPSKEYWYVKLFTTKNYINVGLIAKKYGGGGHKGAAGFQCKELPFEIQ